jgi:exopolyphosphatase/pppGpp-phosphohydrolase
MTRRTAPAVLAALLLPLAAAAADLYGGVEIGAKGVKAVVLEVTPRPGGADVKVLFSKSTNVGLAPTDKGAKLDPKATGEAAAAVAEYVKVLTAEHKVDPARVSVVGSSGLLAANAGNADLVKANQEALAAAVKKAAGVAVAYLDADREATLSIAGTLPPAHAADGLLVDVGGGNTKGGCRAEKGFATFAVPFGTSTFAAAVAKKGGPFPAAAVELAKAELAPAVKTAFAANPAFAKKTHVYLSGGVVWAVATLAHPADRSAYTPLTAGDFNAVEKMLAASADGVPTPDLAGVADAAARKEAEKEVEAVKKVYTRDQLLAGVQILKAVAAELDLAGGEKTVAFARHGQYAWIIGYVADKSGDGK